MQETAGLALVINGTVKFTDKVATAAEIKAAGNEVYEKFMKGKSMGQCITALAIALILAGSAKAELPSATASTVRQALSSGKPTVIDLGARTCIPCREMAPILESLSNEYRGKASVLFIDVREDRAAAQKFRVQMIPTQIFFDAKAREVKRHVGFMGKSDIVKELKAAGLK